MKLVDGKVSLFNPFFNMDDDTQRESLKKLALLTGIEYIFTAHNGYTNDAMNAFDDF